MSDSVPASALDPLFELSLDPLCVIDFRGDFVALNSAWQRILGHDPAALVGTPAIELVAFTERSRVESAAQRAAAGDVVADTVQIRSADGEFRPFHVRVEPHPELQVAYAVLREISAYEERDFIRAILDNAVALVVVTDPEGRILEFNSASERASGRTFEDVRGKVLWETPLLDPELAEPMAMQYLGARAEAFPAEWEGDWIRADGARRRITWRVSVLVDDRERILHFVLTGEDVTEQRELELQLVHSQKMEAVGRLAGGVAHDFNNLLSVILNHAKFALEGIGAGTPESDDVQQIHEAASRAAALTRQLLLFSRRDTATPERLDVNKTVVEMQRLLRRVLGEDVSLNTKLEAMLPVEIARSHLEQILINLAVNARDAMPSGGELTIETDDADWDATQATVYDAPSGRYVRVMVRDTGTGMPAEVLEHAFEPFYTTKEMGQGTGLGLSLVYGLLKQAGGGIRVESEPDQGATFVFCIPMAPDRPASQVPSELPPAEQRGKGERVLVVEDERAVRRAVARLLRRNGYVVSQAASGEEALALIADGLEVELVLTDVVMPGVSGTEMATRLAETHPSLPVVYMSGYTADFLAHHGAEDVMLIQKPFDEGELKHLLRRALDL